MIQHVTFFPDNRRIVRNIYRKIYLDMVQNIDLLFLCVDSPIYQAYIGQIYVLTDLGVPHMATDLEEAFVAMQVDMTFLWLSAFWRRLEYPEEYQRIEALAKQYGACDQYLAQLLQITPTTTETIFTHALQPFVATFLRQSCCTATHICGPHSIPPQTTQSPK